MANVFDVVSFETPTTTGNQVIPVNLGGLTPKLVMFRWNNYDDNTSPSSIDHEVLGEGCSDGTNEHCFCIRTTDNLATTDTRRIATTTKCVMIIDPTAASVVEEAEFVSFAADTVTINWTTIDASNSRRVICTVLAGDIEAAVGVSDLGSSAQTINVTGLGFRPDVITTSGIMDDYDHSMVVHAIWATGIAWDAGGGSIGERCLAWEDDWNATSVRRDLRRINTASFRPANGPTANITDLNSDGFDITVYSSWGGDDMGWVAINMGGAAFSVLDWTTPTSTGNASKTGMGFPPKLVMVWGSSIETANGLDASAEAGGTAFGAFTDQGQQFASATFGQDWVTVSNSASFFADTLAYASGTEVASFAIQAEYVSMDADGFTLNHIQAHSSVTYGHLLAFAEEVPQARVTQQYVENIIVPSPPNGPRVTQHYVENIRTWLEPQIITPGSRNINIEK